MLGDLAQAKPSVPTAETCLGAAIGDCFGYGVDIAF